MEGGFAYRDLLVAAPLTLLVIIVARFAWVYPATYLPRWLSPSLARRDPSPKWQSPFIIAFTGIRGVVSLAAALAIPLLTAGGEPFPERNMILAVTFVVIVVTLVGQGLLLPTVIKKLGLAQDVANEWEDDRIDALSTRTGAVRAALARLEELAEERRLPPDLLEGLRQHQGTRLKQLERAEKELAWSQLTDEVALELIAAERRHIDGALRDGSIRDESRRRVERELDLREAQIKQGFGIDGAGV